MGAKCIVCNSTQAKDKTLSFHRFPKEKERREKWLKACHQKDADIKATSCVCSKHFLISDYDECYWPAHKLLSTAIPSPSNRYFVTNPVVNAKQLEQVSFSDGNQVLNKVGAVNCEGRAASSIKPPTDCAPKLRIQRLVDTPSTALSQSEPSPSLTDLDPLQTVCLSSSNQNQNETEAVISKEVRLFPRYPGDLTVEHFSTPKKAKLSLALISEALQKERKKVKFLQIQNKRLKNKIDSFKTLLQNSHESKLVSEETSQTQ